MIDLEGGLAEQCIVCCGFTGGAVACFEGMQAPISKMPISTGIQMARTIVLDRSELKKICRAVMLESSPKVAIRNPPSQLAEGVEERPGEDARGVGRLEGNDATQPT
jgi:hypothetical protein